MLLNIQRAILSSYLFGDVEKPTILDEDYFCVSLKVFVAKINEFITKDIPLTILNIKLEESLRGHNLENTYLHIIIQTPLPESVVSKYYEYLKIEKRKRLLLGAF